MYMSSLIRHVGITNVLNYFFYRIETYTSHMYELTYIIFYLLLTCRNLRQFPTRSLLTKPIV